MQVLFLCLIDYRLICALLYCLGFGSIWVEAAAVGGGESEGTVEAGEYHGEATHRHIRLLDGDPHKEEDHDKGKEQ